jgi:hypothetical protein
VLSLAIAGASRITFQFELEGGREGERDRSVTGEGIKVKIAEGVKEWREGVKVNGAVKMALAIRRAGMLCGVCVAPGNSLP